MIQFVDYVRQTDRVDVEHGSRVRIGTHLRRVARDQKQVVHPKRGRPQNVRHHPEQIPIATAVVEYGFDPDFLLHHYRGGHRAHACLRPGAVGNIDAINACILQQTNRVERLSWIATFRRQHFDSRDKFAPGDFSCPV